MNRAFHKQEQAEEGEKPGGLVMFNLRSRLAGSTWSKGGIFCPSFIPSPGCDSHSPLVEVCVDTGLGLSLEQKVQWAETAAARAWQGLRPWDWLLVTVIAEFNSGPGGATGG